MTAPALFRYDDQIAVRVVSIDGEPWFVASDVAAILGYRMASDMTRRLDDDEKGTHSVRTPSGDQDMTVLTESGLYSAILGSRVDGAKEFKHWVTREVLPAIRKTGSYGTVAHLSRRDILTMALEAEDRADREAAARLEAEQRAAELALPAANWHILADSAGDYAVGDAAKILTRDPNITIGRDRLFMFMSSQGWIYRARDKRRAWTAYQTQVDLGRLVEKMSRPFLNERTGEMENPAPTIRITAKGLAELHKRLGGVEPVQSMAVTG